MSTPPQKQVSNGAQFVLDASIASALFYLSGAINQCYALCGIYQTTFTAILGAVGALVLYHMAIRLPILGLRGKGDAIKRTATEALVFYLLLTIPTFLIFGLANLTFLYAALSFLVIIYLSKLVGWILVSSARSMLMMSVAKR